MHTAVPRLLLAATMTPQASAPFDPRLTILETMLFNVPDASLVIAILTKASRCEEREKRGETIGAQLVRFEADDDELSTPDLNCLRLPLPPSARSRTAATSRAELRFVAEIKHVRDNVRRRQENPYEMDDQWAAGDSPQKKNPDVSWVL